MKKPYIFLTMTLSLLAAISGCSGKDTQTPEPAEFVSVGPDGRFHIGDSVYNYVGTNFWYGAILASEGRGGDRQRLARELDLLQSLGIDNLRILAGGDGDENIPSHIMPVLQTAPGVYNDTILDGLDYLMAELTSNGPAKAVLPTRPSTVIKHTWIMWHDSYTAIPPKRLPHSM